MLYGLLLTDEHEAYPSGLVRGMIGAMILGMEESV